jgi:hypothetical protein
MTRSMTSLIVAIGCLTLAPHGASAQSFGRDAERARLDAMGRSLAREEEGIARTKAWLKEQVEDLRKRRDNYEKCCKAVKDGIVNWRCPNGCTFNQCSCGASDQFRPRALMCVEMLQREERAINVQRQRLEDLYQSLDRRIVEYEGQKERYRGDVLDFARRYRGYSDDKRLEFDDSAPKSRPR